MPLDANVQFELFKAGLTAIITIIGLLLTWLVGLKFTTQWNIRQKQRELDLSAAEQFRNLYGEFLTVWRLWNANLKNDEEKGVRQWDLLKRACDAEGKVEGILMKLATERHLMPEDIAVLGAFRQGYQQLRESIRDGVKINWGSTNTKPYEVFKSLSCQVGAMIFSNAQQRPPSREDANKALREIMSNRWEEIWMEPSAMDIASRKTV